MGEFHGCDMLVNLTTLPECRDLAEGVKLKRVFAGDKVAVLEFVRSNFSETWVYEAEKAILQSPSRCFIATENGVLIGFACYDTTAKNFFGPIGVQQEQRGKNIGKALLIRTLQAMREEGYGYAIIGWVGSAVEFYRKTVHAELIPGGEPENSVYSNMVRM